MTLHLDCTTNRNSYSGSFLCADPDGILLPVTIDLKFQFARIPSSLGSRCYFIFESAALGYVFTQIEGVDSDTRLTIPLGGAYDDRDTARSECINAGPFEFDADFGRAIDGCGVARIVVNAADYMPQPKPPRRYHDNVDCWCDCVILLLFYQDTQTQITACWDEYDQSWSGIFNVIEGEYDTDYHVKVRLDSRDESGGTILSLVSDFGDRPATKAICDCKPSMYAEWDLQESDARIRVFCEKAPPDCTDCKCFCRCLCFIYNSSTHQGVVHACWDDELHGWHAHFGFYEDEGVAVSLNAYLACDPETGITKMHLTDGSGPVGEPQAVNCPDIAATWVIEEYGSVTTTTISVMCDNCGHCSNLIQTPCCPTPVPLILYATVTGLQSCWRYVTDPLPTLTPCDVAVIPITFDPNPSGMPKWEGEGVITCFLLQDACNVGDRSKDCVVTLRIRVLCGKFVDTVEFFCFGPDYDFKRHSLQMIQSPPSDGYNTCSPVHVTALLGPWGDYWHGLPLSQIACRDPYGNPDGGGDNRGYFFKIVVTE